MVPSDLAYHAWFKSCAIFFENVCGFLPILNLWKRQIIHSFWSIFKNWINNPVYENGKPKSLCHDQFCPFPSGSNAPMLSPFFAPLLWSQSRRDFHFFMLYYFVTTTRSDNLFSSILFNSLHLKHRHLQSSACQLGPKLTYNSSPYYCNIAISHQDKFSLRHTP